MFGDSLDSEGLTVQRGCKGGPVFEGTRVLIYHHSFLANWQRSLEKSCGLSGIAPYLGLSRAKSGYLVLSRVKKVADLLQALGLDGIG